ncbi:hypothetical protein PILCRDRAFT_93581 [Piloderma croceum F 1598]|uniref:Uncharacterized protein n=1 Tax=Piloderma croceum (strain F 1598) TaxID=765440 RepID=A0A0C3EWM0_PILCF|nr:hypothetical protein PILCRDRAFT_93581 [Piloderma croceum F 1598]
MSLSHNEDDEDLRAAMEADSSPPPESPVPEAHNATKRCHSSLSDDDDPATNNGPAPSSQLDSPDPSQPLAISINRNISHHAKQYANRKKLKTEQLAEVDVFLTDTPNNRQVKMFINQLALANQLEKIITAAPPFQVSDSLKASQKNIRGFAFAVISAKNLNGYKKPSTVTIITILASVKPTKKKDDPEVPNADKLNIYDLTKKMIHGTRCVVSVPLCARVALMAFEIVEEEADGWLDEVDSAVMRGSK